MHLLVYLLALLGTGPLLAQASVAGGEWFIDTDPGYGRATPFASVAGGSPVRIDHEFTAADLGLTPGVHTYHARVRDTAGRWSQTLSRTFYVLSGLGPAGLVGGEWFWDADPGYGMGQGFVLTGDTATASIPLDLSALDPGVHYFQVRAADAAGRWGPTLLRSTFIRSQAQARIDRLTYYYAAGGDTTATFTYRLAEPVHYVEVAFAPETTDLVDDETYDICLTAIRTDDRASFATCRSFQYRAGSTAVEDAADSFLRLFPNPTTGTFRVVLPGMETAAGEFHLFDTAGRSVLRRHIVAGETGTMDFAVGNLAAGVYFAVLERGRSVRVQRVTIR
ncbi:T9SS type A sorting domain-containing protein [Lewinella sp. IMCC34183]|uniref:T9SS type A sorting domain-containing protein n=1 Tax=Lewinella sp. IMCC34183 TaxID=2248762 RepID=UPI000E285F95|nr:T9SS type A sorting domain-containing protein [Lewinella sp. IMCC34183]